MNNQVSTQGILLFYHNLLIFQRYCALDDESQIPLLLNLVSAVSTFIRNPQISRPRTYGFWADILPSLTDGNLNNYDINDEFKRHFRMQRSTFENIVEKLRGHPNYAINSFHAQIQLERQAVIVLSRLANNTPIRVLAQTFGVSEGSISEFTDRFLNAMLDKFKDKISWPTAAEVDNVCADFAKDRLRGRLLRCIGAIDGTLIRIQTPAEDPDRYRGRKNFCALNVLAVCNYHKKFTYVYVGLTGRVHDTGVLKMSQLWRAAQDPQQRTEYFPNNTYIIGDAGFPNYDWLLAAYKQHNLISHEQRRYNKVQSSTRMSIERAFGQLKCRWRILLETIRSYNIIRICEIIYVCCILHNICIEYNEELVEEVGGAFRDDIIGQDIENNGNDDNNDHLTRREQVVQEIWNMYPH